MEKGCKNSFSRLPRDPDQTHPWLLVSHGDDYQFHTFYDISKNEYIKRNIPEFRYKQVAATSYGWLLLIDYTIHPLQCCLVNITSKERIELPHIEYESLSTSSFFYECVLSKPPNDPYCYVLLVASCKDYLLFCRVGEEKFIKRPKQFEDDFFETATNFKGKIYAWMSVSGKLVEVDFVGPELLLNELVNDKGQLCQIPWPSPSNTYACEDHLVDSCGELLLVHMNGYIHSREVSYFRIFKIKICEREWEELRSIGDRAIFLCPIGSMSFLCTDKSRLKKNSIYYTRFGTTTNIYVYDIEDRSKTLKKPCPTKGDIRPLMSWIVL
ncbi:hypothetical protein CDL12_16721 [Handroanthus impetiginosus]|uniref:KIB1-4 beta-propeller domain-containing protein n=1 Tax=Handroanthus impetiginosus TaxID=429701 RepID=A0A2G9GZH7_9LAMI|nr:hypothetical protein CDL12_16721 [Handroanthus impetiginosus]